jgi:hypothetical protein
MTLVREDIAEQTAQVLRNINGIMTTESPHLPKNVLLKIDAICIKPK